MAKKNTQTLPTRNTAQLPADVAALVTDAQRFITQARAANTRRGYRADWADFTAWCSAHGAQALPADPRVVALYLTALANGSRSPDGRWRSRPKKVTTISRRLSAIQHYHRAAGHELDTRDHTLRDTWRGIRRTLGTGSVGKAPIVTEYLKALLETLDAETLVGARDRALLLVDFAGCFRRSELVSLDVENVVFQADGLMITLPRSKTDQEGKGDVRGIPFGAHPETCPVRSLEHWLRAAEIVDGPIFRPVTRHGGVRPQRLTPQSVALIVKRAVGAARLAALAAGNRWLAQTLDPRYYAGHSLRAGFITSAAAAGVSESDIMRQSGHARGDTLRKYIRHATVFRHNAAAKVGL
jgi:site-specific recombinase XerD